MFLHFILEETVPSRMGKPRTNYLKDTAKTDYELCKSMFSLCDSGREDLARQHRRPGGYDGRLFTDVASTTAMTNKWLKDEDDGMEYLDKEV